MGLDIWTSDDKKNFHIGYIGFTKMRSFFVRHYGKELYDDYEEIVKATMAFIPAETVVDEDEFYKQIGDLSILINHSDCDGELSSEECQVLKSCLFVDEEKIRSLKIYNNNPEYVERMIKKMYEFIDLINYSATENVKLIFG